MMSKYGKYRKFDKYFEGNDLPLDDTEMYERLNEFKKEYYEALDKQFEEKYAQHLKDIDEIKKDEIILSVNGAGSNELLKKHAQNRKNFDEKLLSYMEEYEENNIEMEFDEWIELKLLDLI